jgi:hypothetical protein
MAEDLKELFDFEAGWTRISLSVRTYRQEDSNDFIVKS